MRRVKTLPASPLFIRNYTQRDCSASGGKEIYPVRKQTTKKTKKQKQIVMFVPYSPFFVTQLTARL